MKAVKKVTVSGLVMALYVTIMFLTQGFAFGQFQIRIATSIYALAAIHPFLIIPLGLANLLSNVLMGGLGIMDMIGGLFVGILTSTLIYQVKKNQWNDWLIAFPIVLVPGLVVPLWLSPLLNVPYHLLVFSLVVGQVLPGIVGVLLIKRLKNHVI